VRTLVGIVAYGDSKAYIMPKFNEMLDACIRPVEAVDIAWVSDRHIKNGDFNLIMTGSHLYVEDMLIEGRELLRKFALQHGYTKLCHQGVDCLWQSQQGFERVLSHDVPIVGPLITARNDPDFAVARRFHAEGVEPPYQYKEEQYDIPEFELESGLLIPSGFPGADAIFYRQDVMDLSFEGHKPWYLRVRDGETNIECMEYTILNAANRGQAAYVDTMVKVWHVHENGVANMWKGITKPMNELEWPAS
jgi:hypothetical protein